MPPSKLLQALCSTASTTYARPPWVSCWVRVNAAPGASCRAVPAPVWTWRATRSASSCRSAFDWAAAASGKRPARGAEKTSSAGRPAGSASARAAPAATCSVCQLLVACAVAVACRRSRNRLIASVDSVASMRWKRMVPSSGTGASRSRITQVCPAGAASSTSKCQARPASASRRSRKLKSSSRYWVVIARTGTAWVASQRKADSGWSSSTRETMPWTSRSWNTSALRRSRSRAVNGSSTRV